MTRLAVSVLAALLLFSQPSQALKVYKWRSDGGTEYSDRPPSTLKRDTSPRPDRVWVLKLHSWTSKLRMRRRSGDHRPIGRSLASSGAASAAPSAGGVGQAAVESTLPSTAPESTGSPSAEAVSPAADSGDTLFLEPAAETTPAEPAGAPVAPEPLAEPVTPPAVVEPELSEPATAPAPVEPIAMITPSEPALEPVSPTATALPVYPGAEGFGTETRAGRGGKVIAVTSLADSGPGTLREALEYPGPRIIVFRVGGVIELSDFLFVRHPFVTVAGQTAPGDGIALKNFGLVIPTNDVLVQHIRVRPGNEGSLDPTGNDAIAIFGRHGSVSGAYNVVIDHVSASWSEDEVVSTWFAPRDITISWSILSEALKQSRHPKTTHSAGLLIGDGSDRISVRHSLLAHNDFRNPLIIGGGQHDFSNNVVYDWGDISTEIIDDAPTTNLTLLGNRYIPGPSTRREHEMLINPTGSSHVVKVFMKDNVAPSFESSAGGDWKLYYGWSGQVAPAEYRSPTQVTSAPIATLSASTNLNRVLAEAGATLPDRDAVDERVVAQVKSGSGAIIDTPDDVGGYPSYARGIPLADSDNDGMPDFWESQLGFDPARTDSNGDADGDGYTNIEEYLHALTD